MAGIVISFRWLSHSLLFREWYSPFSFLCIWKFKESKCVWCCGSRAGIEFKLFSFVIVSTIGRWRQRLFQTTSTMRCDTTNVCDCRHWRNITYWLLYERSENHEFRTSNTRAAFFSIVHSTSKQQSFCFDCIRFWVCGGLNVSRRLLFCIRRTKSMHSVGLCCGISVALKSHGIHWCHPTHFHDRLVELNKQNIILINYILFSHKIFIGWWALSLRSVFCLFFFF